MRLTGPGVLGPPPNMGEARRVLRRALELGVRVFDTAWYYGPDVANQLLAEAIRAGPEGVVIATKLGWEWDSAGGLVSAHTPERLRAAMARDLLVGNAIAIVHLRWGSDRSVNESFRRALATMIEMRDDGSFRHIGLSNVGRAQLEYALAETEIASVSNSYSVADQTDDELVDLTAHHGIAYLPGCRCERVLQRRREPSEHGARSWAHRPRRSRSPGCSSEPRTSSRSPEPRR
jgi:pyridoxine 4-dehydrogenase